MGRTSINKVMLIGTVGKDPKSRLTAASKCTSFSLATSEHFGKGDARKEKTEWHYVICWGKLADIVEKYVGKGSLIYVEGRINYRELEKDGKKEKNTEIIANDVRFLNIKKETIAAEYAPPAGDNYPIEQRSDNEDDLSY